MAEFSLTSSTNFTVGTNGEISDVAKRFFAYWFSEMAEHMSSRKCRWRCVLPCTTRMAVSVEFFGDEETMALLVLFLLSSDIRDSTQNDFRNAVKCCHTNYGRNGLALISHCYTDFGPTVSAQTSDVLIFSNSLCIT